MTKIKRLLAVVTASMLTLGSISAINADAFYGFTEKDMYESEVFEEFNDCGHLNEGAVGDPFAAIDENGNAIYKLYKIKEKPALFCEVGCPQQNMILIDFVDGTTEDAWRPIFEKYSEQLDYDYTQYTDVWINQFTGFHNRDENGEFTFDMNSVQDKYDVVKEMCAELREAGIVKSAIYTRYNTIVEDCSIGTYLGISNYTGDISELQAFFQEYDETFVVEDRGNGLYRVDIGLTTEDLRWEISSALEERFTGVDAKTDIFEEYMGGSEITVGSVNILTALNEEESCDTDQSGTVEITDATAILASYANTAAGIAAASAENPMDVNGDGAVGIDDATFVLTVYAELAAGMR